MDPAPPGPGRLWTVLAPAAVLTPLAINVGIAAVAEAFARIPVSFSVLRVPTSNAGYWVITITLTLVAIAAADSQSSENRYRTANTSARDPVAMVRCRWGQWLFYSLLGAALAAVTMVIVLAALPVVSTGVRNGVGGRPRRVAPSDGPPPCWGSSPPAWNRCGCAGALTTGCWCRHRCVDVRGRDSRRLSAWRSCRATVHARAERGYAAGRNRADPAVVRTSRCCTMCALCAVAFGVGVCRLRIHDSAKKDDPLSDTDSVPMAGRSDADLPGHWLLARLGKRVLRPGGLGGDEQGARRRPADRRRRCRTGPGPQPHRGGHRRPAPACAPTSASTTPPPQPNPCARSSHPWAAPSWWPMPPTPDCPAAAPTW